MDRTSAISSLKSVHSHERLRAARALAGSAQKDDWDEILAAHATESVPWIKRSLRNTMDRLSGVEGTQEPEVSSVAPDEDDFAAEVYSQAVETTASEILHQLAAPLGLAREHARVEIADYNGSETKKQLLRLSGLMEAIDTLQRSASPARPRRFDLGDLVVTTAQSCADSANAVPHDPPSAAIACRTTGPVPLWIYSDPGLVETALSNAITNAIEAVFEAGSENDPSAVVITWEQSEVENWISVIDRGGGLPPNFQSAFQFGVSSKDGHHGAGLALAQRAMRSLGGRVVLRPSGEQGCLLEIAWPRNRFEEPCES